MTTSLVGQESAALEVWDRVPESRPRPGISGATIRPESAVFGLLSQSSQKKGKQLEQDRSDAFSACVEANDPAVSQIGREAADNALRAALSALEAWQEEATAELDAAQDNIVAAGAERKAARQVQMRELLAAFKQLAVEHDADQQALAYLRNHDSRKRWLTPRSPKVIGGPSLYNLETAVEAMTPPPPVERVSQREYQQRRDAGEDVSNLAISHSPGGLQQVARPEFE